MAIEDFLRKTQAQLESALEQIGEDAVEFVRDELSTPYPPASSPGDPPHMRTGELRESINYQIIGDTLRVGSSSPYAVWLEYGTEKMAARPFLRPANQTLIEQLPALLAKYIKG